MKKLMDMQLKSIFPAATLGFLMLASSATIATEISNEDNNSFVISMYGFQNEKYFSEAESYTDDDYAADLAESIFGKQIGPDYSKEDVYVEALVRSVEGLSQPNAPDFSKDEVYVNHLVEVISK